MSLEDVSDGARDELAALSRKLSEDPATRKEFLRLTKKVRPDLPIPELDIEERTNAVLQRSNEKIDALQAKLRERDAVEDLKNRRRNLLTKGLVESEEDIPAIEKIMLEKNIANHETAAEYHKWMKQAAVPTPSGYNPNPMKKFDLSAFTKNPSGAARDMARQALDEIRRPVRPIGL